MNKLNEILFRFVKSVVAGNNEGTKPKIRKMSESASATSFQDFHESVLESTLKNQKTEEIPPPKYVDISVQVHILPERFDEDSNLLVCNRFEKDSVCEVQTQANLQPILRKHVTFNTVKVSDKCCGSDITVEEKCIGPDSNDLNDKLMIKCREGFHGVQSITNDNDMNDIAGVKLAVYQLLLQFISPTKNEKLSKENRLLL